MDTFRIIFCFHVSDTSISSYLGAHKERIELGEDAEHFVGALGCTQTVTETRNDLVLNTRDTLVVGSLGLDPDLGTLCVVEANVNKGNLFFYG